MVWWGKGGRDDFSNSRRGGETGFVALWTTGRTKGIGLLGHAIASSMETRHDVAVTGLEDAGLDFAVVVRALFALNDRKVVVSQEAARETLRANRGSKDNHILCDGAVQERHLAHGATSYVENPLFVGVDVVGIDFGELRGNAADLFSCGNVHQRGLMSNLVENLRIKHEELLTVDINDGEDDRNQQSDRREQPEAATAGLLGLRGTRRHFRCFGVNPKAQGRTGSPQRRRLCFRAV